MPRLHDGELTHVSIRRPLKEEPKYVSIECPKKPNKILFYVPGDRQVLCVVEGEFDALLLNQETGLSCAATGAATTISDELSWLATSFKTLVIAPDSDGAGEKMGALWQQAFTNAQVVLHMPAHDVTDYYLQGGNLMDWWRGQDAFLPAWVREA